MALSLASPEPPSDLTDYVRKSDPSFVWSRGGKIETPGATVYDLKLTSQTWHDIKWEHGLQVFVPTGTKPTATFVLWNQGGSPSPSSALLGVLLAEKMQAPVVFLYGVPNQPLFGGKKEDALIAETFVRYLETGDGTWPLLFPMVKSVTAAMDAVQAFAAKEWDGHKVTHFIITGASKRGWTSWLTAATSDPRVKAIAPLVIDTLNMQQQMPNQVKSFGRFSDMIRDYTDRKLVPVPDTPAAKKLWAMIDPWVYRDRLKLPKLIINGTNDPYWTLDALNFYWDDLPGEKRLLYVPNAGHGLNETDTNGHGNRDRAVNTLCAFCRSQVKGESFPKLTWKFADDQPDMVELPVQSDATFKTLRFWSANSATRDFRPVRWSATESKQPTLEVKRPATGFCAFFAEAEYEKAGLTFYLSTQLRILEQKK